MRFLCTNCRNRSLCFGDASSIGGYASPARTQLDHVARKNINLTYVIMDNFVYGLTKKQTSPTSPIGFKSKTDPTGAIDHPVYPMKSSSGAEPPSSPAPTPRRSIT